MLWDAFDKMPTREYFARMQDIENRERALIQADAHRPPVEEPSEPVPRVMPQLPPVQHQFGQQLNAQY